MAVIHMLSGEGIAEVGLGTGTGLGYLRKYGLGSFQYRGREIDCFVTTGSGLSIGQPTTWYDIGRAFRMDNSSTAARLHYSIPTTDPVFDLDRNGTWFIHVSMQAGGYGPTTNYVNIPYLDADGASQTLTLSAAFANKGMVPIEVIVDWVSMAITVYKAGEQMAYVNFTMITGAIDVGYCSRVATNTGGWSVINNLYFVIDHPDDPNPTGRLGPCVVQAEPLATYITDGNFDPIDPAVALPILNTFNPATALTAESVVTDGSSKQLTVGVDPASVNDAIAAYVTVLTFKDSFSMANTVGKANLPGAEEIVAETPSTSINGSISYAINSNANGDPLTKAGDIPTVSIWSKL
ncbi:hypothetical protein pEaSNUABM37_00341 [Erwinia phage pEa_SNUABM_37]|nr:hypothetical protein pEaSNUABM37_00341 [Erwinia phage pEa_SNUABM_37]QXO10809.1 hypothetical protein pEaSNUABM48_00341 [Erwinia phage pEa_SNUABM_48]